MDSIKTVFLECACYSDEHTLKFTLDIDPECVDFYTSVFLNQTNNFFKRIWVALKYVFGYKCKYGHWDCFLLRKEDTTKLIEMLQEYKMAFK